MKSLSHGGHLVSFTAEHMPHFFAQPSKDMSMASKRLPVSVFHVSSHVPFAGAWSLPVLGTQWSSWLRSQQRRGQWPFLPLPGRCTLQDLSLRLHWVFLSATSLAHVGCIFTYDGFNIEAKVWTDFHSLGHGFTFRTLGSKTWLP